MTIYQDGGRFPEFYRPGGISAPPPGSAGALPPIFYLPVTDKKPGMLSGPTSVLPQGSGIALFGSEEGSIPGWGFPNSGALYPTQEEALAAYNSPLRGKEAGQAYVRAQNPNYYYNWDYGENPLVIDRTTGEIIAYPSTPSKGAGFVEPLLFAAGGAFAPGISELFGGGMLGAIGTGATLGAGNAAITGQDIGKGIVQGAKGGAIGGGIGAAADLAAPFVNSSLDSVKAALNLPSNVGSEEFLKNLQVADASGSMGLPTIPVGLQDITPTIPDISPEHLSAISAGAQGMLSIPTGLQEVNPTVPEISAADQAAIAAGAGKITPADLQRISKLTQSLAKLGQGTTPQDAPQREKGQSDEQYAQQLAQYANLDSQAMATLGLVPGSQEYYRYIMDQMDSVIAQLTDGMDIDAADLTDQLHAKSAAELQQLQRALYVRGQMDSLVGSGQYVDPFTGQSEDVTAPGGEQFNPAVGAYQRGLARSTGEVAQGGEAGMSALQGMLGRNVDLYGMQGRQNAQRQLAMLDAAVQETSGKKRKGMFGANPADVAGLQDQVSQMTDQELENLLKRLGI